MIFPLALLLCSLVVLTYTARRMRRLDPVPDTLLDRQEHINHLEHVCEIHDGAGDPVMHQDHCRICRRPQLPPDYSETGSTHRTKVVQCSPFVELGYRQKPPWETGQPWVEEDAQGRVIEHNREAQVFGATVHQAHLDIARHFGVPSLRVER